MHDRRDLSCSRAADDARRIIHPDCPCTHDRPKSKKKQDKAQVWTLGWGRGKEQSPEKLWSGSRAPSIQVRGKKACLRGFGPLVVETGGE